jgi:chromate reductase
MPINRPLRILGVVGSLRKGSYNKQLMLEAQRFIKAVQSDNRISGSSITVYEGIDLLPFVNEDHEKEYYANNKEVAKWKSAIQQSDAILFALPEYNYSIPGVLKNAIDIGTRPYGFNSFAAKAFGFLSASPGTTGGIRSQLALRQSIASFNGVTTGYPEYILPFAYDAFDGSGALKSQRSTELLQQYLKHFVDLTYKHLAGEAVCAAASAASDERAEKCAKL